MQFFNKKNKPISKTCFYVTTKKILAFQKWKKQQLERVKSK